MSQGGYNQATNATLPGDVPTEFTTNSGTAEPASHVLSIAGTGSIATSGATNVVTVGMTGLTNHAVLVGAGTSTITKVGPSSSTGQVLQSQGSSSDPAFSTATYPSTASSSGTILRSDGTNFVSSTATYPNTTTAGQLLYSSASNVVGGITANAYNVIVGNSSAGITNVAPSPTSGVPLISQGSSADPTFGTAVVAGGGSGATSFTAYSVLTGGTTSTGALQNVSGVGTAGQVLTSNGASTLPTWQSLQSAGVVGCTNIGITYSAGTFTVRGNSASLSASNVGYVTMQSKATPGSLVTIAVTADQTFTDGAAGTTDNARFGITTGVNWSQDIPFFLYAVMDDTETLINFMISRNPCAKVSPASTSISKTGAIVNVGQGDFFSLGNVTVTSYDGNPCLVLGSFRMQFTGATDSWTVQTLSSSKDGIGRFNDSTIFVFPTGQMSAAASTYIVSNAGTEPQFTTNEYTYSISQDGMVYCNVNLRNCSVSGVGAQVIQLVLPYANGSYQTGYCSTLTYATGLNVAYILMFAIAPSVNYTSSSSGFLVNASSTEFTNASISNANSGDSIQGQIIYKAFDGL